MPESRNEAQVRHFDAAGAITVTAGLIVLVYAIVKSIDWGWGSASTLGLIAVAAALLAAFVAIERRSHAPLVRLDLFRLRSLATANGVMLLVFSGMFAMFFFCTLYLQKVLGYSALETGLAFLPVSVGIVIGSVLAQQLIGRLGTKRVLATGTTLAAAGLATLAATTSVDGTYLELLAALAPLSIGMGLTFVPMTLVATTNVAKEDAGLASGVFNTSQQVGGALGLAVLSTFANDRTASALADGAQQSAALVDGFQIAFVIAAGLVATGAVVARPCCDAATSRGSTRATWTWPRRPPRPLEPLAMAHTIEDMATTEASARELRADAQRNRERIVAAAVEVFAERGLDASTAEIAQRAGVGEATLFRASVQGRADPGDRRDADGGGDRDRHRLPRGP